MREANQPSAWAVAPSTRPVYVVDGTRTPFLKATGGRGPFSASDLAVQAGRTLLNRLPILPADIDQVVMGCVMPSENEANIGRLIAVRLGCPHHIPGWTVQRNCASGMQALDSAIKDVALGRYDLVLAGGAEAMSRTALLYSDVMVDWLTRFRHTKGFFNKCSVLTQWRPSYLSPVIGLLKGLTDPLIDLNMGQTAEILAYRYGITRQAMDEYALESHQRLAAAQDESELREEISTVYDTRGRYYSEDNGVRRDTTLERLYRLKPQFDRRFGKVTAGNSSQITDGAAVLLLASEAAVKRHKLPVLGRIVDTAWGALSPDVMGLGPVVATNQLLSRQQLSLNDIDYWEINEAFAAQVLACLNAWEDEDFFRQQNGQVPMISGKIQRSRLNIEGGAIALGHPVGATGARLVLHLLQLLKRRQATRGVATLCIGGGQGGAMLLERLA